MRFRAKGSYLEQQCDKYMGILVRSRGECEVCGYMDTLQWAHIKGRADHTLRWDPLNALCLCDSCHRAGHASPKKFEALLYEKFPQQMEYLDSIQDLTLHRKDSDFREILEAIKAVIAGDLGSLEKLIVGAK